MQAVLNIYDLKGINMTQEYVRRILGDFYRYRFLDSIIEDEEMSRKMFKVQERFKRITNIWNDELNSEWVLRHYLATKMIMSATLLINSMDFANERNLRIVEPYLFYYSVLTLCRAVVYTTPEKQWNDGKIMTMTHTKIINSACSAIGSINSDLGQKVKKFITCAQEMRELYSYKFPANGLLTYFDSKENGWDLFIEICTTLAEIAQFQSEQLEYCLNKMKNKYFTLDFTFLENGFIYKGNNFEFIDNEDYYRLGYFKRKQSYPVNLYFTLREGMVDDFFGAWSKEVEIESEEDELFNPDNNIRIIFDMP